MSNYWSEEQIGKLIAIFNHPHINVETLLMLDTTLPEKTFEQKERKAYRLGLIRLDNKLWTEWEEQVIAHVYPTMGSRLCGEILSHRLPQSIRTKASKMGIRSYKHSKYKRAYAWYRHEDELLIQHGNKTLEELRKVLPRKGTHAISNRRKKLQRLLLNTPEIWIQPDKVIDVDKLPNDTYQILLGSVLAFRDISNSVLSVGFRGAQSKRLRDFTHWTSNNLGEFMPHIDIKGYPIMEAYNRFPLQHLSRAFDIDKLAEGGLPFNHLQRMDETGFFVWYMNKGNSNRIKCSKGYNFYPTIRTERYTHDAVAEAVELLNKRMGVAMKPYFGSVSEPSNRIHLYTKARNKFAPKWSVAHELLNMPPCMDYKLFTLNEKSSTIAPKWWSTEEEKTLMDNITQPLEALLELIPTRDRNSIARKQVRILRGDDLATVRALNR